MAAAAVESLKATFKDQITLPDAASTFEAETNTPWSLSCRQTPAAFIQLKTAEEVSKALSIIKETGCKFAVRTSGHNPNPGFSSTDESGVVLDLRRLKTRELLDDGTARCGAGNTWGDVYTWLEEQKLSAIGGRDCSVGLAGFLLGGGYGALPNLHGTGADGIKSMEVVLSDGKIIIASPDENADLFRALKGGGTNFGIVTRFDLQTHPLIPVQYAINLYKPDDYVNVSKATVSVQNAMEKDPKLGLFTNFNQGFTAVGMCYAEHLKEEHEAFESFRKLDSLMMNACPRTDGTLLSLAAAMSSSHSDQTLNRYCGTITTGVSHEIYESAYLAQEEARKGVPEGGMLHFTIQPAGSACVKAGEIRGGNCMGLEAVPQVWWVFTCEWPKGSEKDDSAARDAIHAMVDGVKDAAQSRGLLLEFLCPNFAALTQKVLGSYGTENVKKAKAVAAKYDADGVFQKLQNGGFLLRNSV